MDKQEIIELIRNSLSIEILKKEHNYGNNLVVQLKLENEVISYDFIDISELAE